MSSCRGYELDLALDLPRRTSLWRWGQRWRCFSYAIAHGSILHAVWDAATDLAEWTGWQEAAEHVAPDAVAPRGCCRASPRGWASAASTSTRTPRTSSSSRCPLTRMPSSGASTTPPAPPRPPCRACPSRRAPDLEPPQRHGQVERPGRLAREHLDQPPELLLGLLALLLPLERGLALRDLELREPPAELPQRILRALEPLRRVVVLGRDRDRFLGLEPR